MKVGVIMSKTYTQDEAAERLQVSRATVARWIESGNLTRSTVNGRLKITDQDLRKVKKPVKVGYGNILYGKLISATSDVIEIARKNNNLSDDDLEKLKNAEQFIAEIKKQ
jgi:excisionase family DNA binding protein